MGRQRRNLPRGRPVPRPGRPPAGPGSRRRYGLVAALLMCCALLGAPAPGQVVIESARWGFDGTSLIGCFNLLAVELRNVGSRTFDGPVHLSNGGLGGGIGGAGARDSVRCVLSPGTSRTVRFYPYLAGPNQDWQVSVGKEWLRIGEGVGDRGVEVLPGPPAVVMLRSRDALAPRDGSFPVFPEEDFPATVAATGALGRVLLDHVPAFQPVQARAFLDWLRGGGELHLGLARDNPGPSGFPRFTGELSVLDDDRDRFPVGAGVVIKHRRQFGPGDPLSQLTREARRARGQHATTWTGNVLRALGDIVRPDHSWPLIYLVLFLFFVAVVPFHAWLSFKKVGYLGSIAVLLSLTTVFAWLLFQIGRRGYGESSSVHSITYAKVLEDGRFDAFQYKNLFSTTSTVQAILHAAQGSLYSAATHDESIPGRVFHDGAPRFEVAVPLFTSRPFVHRGVVQGDPVRATPGSWNDRDPLQRVDLRWEGPEVLQGYAFHDQRCVPLRAEDGRLVSAGAAELLRSVFEIDKKAPYYPMIEEFGPAADPARIMEQYLPRIVDERWRIGPGFSATERSGPGSIRLLLMCRVTDPFRIRRPGGAGVAADEQGYVLYDMTIHGGR